MNGELAVSGARARAESNGPGRAASRDVGGRAEAGRFLAWVTRNARAGACIMRGNRLKNIWPASVAQRADVRLCVQEAWVRIPMCAYSKK